MTPILRSEVPRGRKLVRMTWVYNMKRDGTQKACLCVQGCSQVHGVDYDQLWSGTARSSRVVAACALLARRQGEAPHAAIHEWADLIKLAIHPVNQVMISHRSS